MTLGDLNEALGVVDTMLTTLLGTLSGNVGREGAALRYAIGDLQAEAPALVSTGTIGLPLLGCFMAAFYAGAGYAAFDKVRLAMQAEAPIGLPGAIIANLGIRFTLGRQARVLAAITFTSSQDVFAAIAAVNGAFEAAEEYAADNRDPASYQALLALHAAVTQDLTTRAMSLPSLVTFTMPRILTSHALANRLYGDASRCDEIRAENKIIHPAFCPPSGTALSE